jgi:hypothetical protein
MVALATSGAMCAAAAVVACGFDGGGLGASSDDGGGGGADAAGTSDTESDRDAGSLPEGATCIASLPTGWSVVQYESDRKTCPTGGTPHAVVGNPVVGPGACGCNCTNDVPPSCTTGSVQFFYSYMTGQCQYEGGAFTFNDGTCLGPYQGAGIAPQSAAKPLGVQGGHCTSTEQRDAAAVTTTEVGVCDVDGRDQESVCNGISESGFEACIATANEAMCPGSPFTKRYVVYDGVALVCDPCGACTPGGSCQNATATFYDTGMMPCDPMAAVATVTIDGNCWGSAGNSDTPFRYVDYSALLVPPAGTCTVPAPDAGFLTTGTHTVCCRD